MFGFKEDGTALEPTLAEKFNYFDLDQDGKFTYTEFEKLIEEHGLDLGTNKEGEKDFFNYFDLNKDGYIDFEEFETMVNKSE